MPLLLSQFFTQEAAMADNRIVICSTICRNVPQNVSNSIHEIDELQHLTSLYMSAGLRAPPCMGLRSGRSSATGVGKSGGGDTARCVTVRALSGMLLCLLSLLVLAELNLR